MIYPALFLSYIYYIAPSNIWITLNISTLPDPFQHFWKGLFERVCFFFFFEFVHVPLFLSLHYKNIVRTDCSSGAFVLDIFILFVELLALRSYAASLSYTIWLWRYFSPLLSRHTSGLGQSSEAYLLRKRNSLSGLWNEPVNVYFLFIDSQATTLGRNRW